MCETDRCGGGGGGVRCNFNNVWTVFWEEVVGFEPRPVGGGFEEGGEVWNFKNCRERSVRKGLSGFVVGCCESMFVGLQG